MIIPTASPGPFAPTNLTATAGDTTAVVQWTANTSGAATNISNSETNGNPNAVVFETPNADPSLNFGANGLRHRGDRSGHTLVDQEIACIRVERDRRWPPMQKLPLEVFRDHEDSVDTLAGQLPGRAW